MDMEQKKHQEEYLIAKKRYENSIMEKKRVENQIIDIQNHRHQLINQINELQSERKRFIESSEELAGRNSADSEFESGWKDSESKLVAASQGFIAIGTSSLGSPQNLSEVFAEKNRLTKSSMQEVFDGIKKACDNMQMKIEELSRQITNAESELEDGRNRERYLHNIAEENSRIANNASIEMAYHKKYLV